MSASLFQSSDAAFPDRPRDGGQGLAVELAAGATGQALSIDLSGFEGPLTVRLLLAPNTCVGGRVAVVVGRSSGGDGCALRFDPISRSVVLDVGGEAVLAGDLPGRLAWHSVEIVLDATAGSAELWVNGIGVAQTSGLTALSVPTELLMGAVYKDHGATGTLYLDEVVVADGYVGPVWVEPSSEHMVDPTRWAVIYNTASDESQQWAEHYRAARSVPYANLIGLALDTAETMGQSAFEAMRDDIAAYLNRNSLDSRVGGIIVGHGVPGRYTRSDGQAGSVAAQLQKIDGYEIEAANPVAAADLPTRPTIAQLDGTRITARIDGPTLADSTQRVDRAVTIGHEGLGSGADAKLWFDPITTGPIYEVFVDDMLDWASSLDRQATRLRFESTAATDPPTDPAFSSVSNDGFYWGWRTTAPPAGFFAEPAGARVFCAGLDDLTATAPTLRDMASNSWAATALRMGYAAACGTARPVSVSALPLVRPFFQALRAGWTLGEAWGAATPAVRAGIELIGDPLMCVPLPQAGWNLYGPFDAYESASADQPIAHLRDDERSVLISGPDRPDNESSALYLLRRVDAQGREGADVPIAVGHRSGVATSPPPVPTWPNRSQWSPRIVGGSVEIVAEFAQPFGDTVIVRVDLVEQELGGAITVAEQSEIRPSDAAVRFTQPIEGATRRYRLRSVGADGTPADSPWSRWLSSTSPVPQPIDLVPSPPEVT